MAVPLGEEFINRIESMIHEAHYTALRSLQLRIDGDPEALVYRSRHVRRSYGPVNRRASDGVGTSYGLTALNPTAG